MCSVIHLRYSHQQMIKVPFVSHLWWNLHCQTCVFLSSDAVEQRCIIYSLSIVCHLTLLLVLEGILTPRPPCYETMLWIDVFKTPGSLGATLQYFLELQRTEAKRNQLPVDEKPELDPLCVLQFRPGTSPVCIYLTFLFPFLKNFFSKLKCVMKSSS